MNRRQLIAAGLAATAAPLPAATPREDWQALAGEVKAAMRFAFAAYRQIAWGQDEVKPVSGGGQSFLIPGASVGLSIVEALDTLWLMGLDAELEDAVRWIHQRLTFDLDGDAQVFEASIRLVGGLLSGHLATGDARLLELAHDLASRMMPCFETPTGMPMRYVNLRTGKTRDGQSFPAEIGGGMAPEYVTLSRLTGERRFADKAVAAMLALHARRSKIGLVGDTIDVTTGQWVGRRATVGPPTDSYLEYLWDTWRLTGDVRCRDAYRVETAAILARMADRTTGDLWFANVDFETGAKLSLRQSELSAYYGGLLSEGGDHDAGVAAMTGWIAAQDRYGVLPEAFDPTDWRVLAPTNALRPELADGAFTLWLHDRDERWRHVVAKHFRLMIAKNKAPHGFSGLKDVRTGAQDDACPGYWWSEQMKYYWLIFSDTKRFDYKDNYLSTEGNVLKGLRR
ncbi:glycoside hydrolase family 47 protein [Sphingomonas sp. MA1305]|uniref:glycoside hydrolase family 47 protein n=1 Tax=Sphingomonas sp. MA1305 TaxID=2479204 RepID=UPI0018E0190D|nr:glycoside hydrolase family 47 protein [Sphingomonas sp. MA1305]MBI0475442.1 glycoside hydrolase family 47 protein [Sphingomonas sp. MA1305]